MGSIRFCRKRNLTLQDAFVALTASSKAGEIGCSAFIKRVRCQGPKANHPKVVAHSYVARFAIRDGLLRDKFSTKHMHLPRCLHTGVCKSLFRSLMR